MVTAAEQVRASVGHLRTESELLAIECQSRSIVSNDLVFVSALVRQAMNRVHFGIVCSLIGLKLVVKFILHFKVIFTNGCLRPINLLLESVEIILHFRDLFLESLEGNHEISL